MRPFQGTRRNFLLTAPALIGVAAADAGGRPAAAALFGKDDKTKKDKEAGPTEDLMRRPGVLRPALPGHPPSPPNLPRHPTPAHPPPRRRPPPPLTAFGPR